MNTQRLIRKYLLPVAILLGMAACKKDNPGHSTTAPAARDLSIADLKKMSTAASVTIGSGDTAIRIKGIVVSDRSGKNIDGRTVVLQEGNGKQAIIINFTEKHIFNPGDLVRVGISNVKLEQVDGEIVLNGLPVDSAHKLGRDSIAAMQTTIAYIKAHQADLDGVLVTIPAQSLTGGDGEYTGSLQVGDSTGTTTSLVLPSAVFSETKYPGSVSALTGIVRISGNNTRIDIRHTGDVTMGDIAQIINEDFQDIVSLGLGTTDPGDIRAGGFETRSGLEWKATYNNALFPLVDVPEDEGFLTHDRKYIYLMGAGSGQLDFDQIFMVLGFQGPAKKGLRSISITFAMSRIVRLQYATDWDGTPLYFDLKAFDPATDTVQLMVTPMIGSPFGNSASSFSTGTVTGSLSQKYTEAGKFFTYTWQLPARDELLASGVSGEEIDHFLQRPCFYVYNMSKLAGDTKTNLIVFDKIVFTYGK